MKIITKCEQCGIEREVEIKVPRFCGANCRLANLRARKINDKQSEVPTADSMVSPQQTEGNPPVQPA